MGVTDVLKARPKLVATLIIGAVVVAGAFWIMTRPTPAPVADRRDPPPRVSALGRLEPASGIINVGGPAGARIDHFSPAIKEGARIKRGDVIANLDSYQEAAAAREQAASALEEARRQLKIEVDAGAAAVDAASAQVRHAETSLPLQIQAQEAELRRSTSELQRLRADRARAEKLRAGNAILQSQYDAAVSAETQAGDLVARNTDILAQLKQDQAIQLDASHAALRQAQAASVRGELSARVRSATAALHVAQARLDLAQIRAPITGEILEVVMHAGEAIGAAPILKMGDTTDMVTVADVYESDVRFVRVGQKATITSAALLQPLTGHVARVGAIVSKSDVLGIDPTAATDARTLEVRIRLDAAGGAAHYSRHQVQVEIDTGQGQ